MGERTKLIRNRKGTSGGLLWTLSERSRPVKCGGKFMNIRGAGGFLRRNLLYMFR
jgi:hypothetical protein